MLIYRFIQAGLLISLASVATTGFRAQGVPITGFSGVAGLNLVEMRNPSGTEGTWSWDSDSYEWESLRSVPYEDHGGTGDRLDGVHANVEEWWSVTETEFTFRTLLSVAVLSETPGAYAYAYTDLSLRLDIGELCSYVLFDVEGNVTGTGTVQPGPWHFSKAWEVRVEGVGEKHEIAYFRIAFAPDSSAETVPDSGSTGLLAGLSLIGLAFARRLTDTEPKRVLASI